MVPRPELLIASAGLVGWFLVLFVAERVAPLRRRRRGQLRRLGVNAGLALLSLGVTALVVVPAMRATLDWRQAHGVGLLAWLELPVWVAAPLGFVLLDLTFYGWHRANHRVPLLWRFHLAHHVDPDLDVSTGPRFHVGEMALSAGFRVVQIGLLGVSATTLVIYEVVFQAGTLFHHANVRLPLRVERSLNLLVVTPRMHGVHHSQIRQETDSNYSVVFSVWDRLFRSLRLNVPQDDIRIGVPGHDRARDNHLTSVVLLPFRRRRADWPEPEATLPRDEAPAGRSRMSP